MPEIDNGEGREEHKQEQEDQQEPSYIFVVDAVKAYAAYHHKRDY